MCAICGCEATEATATTSDAASRPARDEIMAQRRAEAVRDYESADWQRVLKRNVVERLKREKFPTEIRAEIPQLATLGFEAAGEGDALKRALLARRMGTAASAAATEAATGRAAYEVISEEDVVRLQWWGLYHDKPRVGYFMMRIKIPGGILTARQLRTVGRLAERYGRNYAELATRQNVQLHWIRLDDFEEIFQTLEADGLTTAGACGDSVRNITACPVAGIAREELFDVTPVLREFATFFYGNREYSDLPRKHKITISADPTQCNAPDFHCIALVGAIKDGRPGFAFRVGGGLSSAPRIARDLRMFVPVDDALAVTRAILDIWREEPRYRLSRVKARIKFMVDELGAEGVRAKVVERLGRDFEDFPAPEPEGEAVHLGVHAQREDGRSYIGFPVHQGLVNGQQMQQLADLAESYGGGYRVTRQQNFVLSDVPDERVEEVVAAVGRIGFPLDLNGIRGLGIGCTGQPLCNFAVASTKSRLDEVVTHLETVFGRDVEDLRVQVDGCPHACAQHWVADIGLQGTTPRERGAGGEKLEAYEVYLRGGVGKDPQIGKAVLRRVPAAKITTYVERLVRAYLEQREPGERFNHYTRRLDDATLIAIASAGEETVATAPAAAEAEEVEA